MAEKIRLGVIFGGRSSEHEVSLVSALHVIDACDRDRFDVVPIGISTLGSWVGTAASQAAIEGARHGTIHRIVRAGDGLLSNLDALGVLQEVDVVFPVTHGTFGEDGSLQGLLELARIPYVGAGVTGSALGMDKVFQKQVLAQVGIPVVDYLVTTESDWREDPMALVREIERTFPFPIFVKPANAGSSVGVSKVRSREDLGSAVERAIEHDHKVLIERAVDGREIECAVLGNHDPKVAPFGEVIADREFYDYDAKYASDSKSQFVTPAYLPEKTENAMKKMAIKAYKAIDCAGMGRVDFFLSRENVAFVNEINTLPGFTPISGYPKMWQAGGLSYPDLIERLVDLALERDRERQGRAKGPENST